jgi:hypothetical protein
MALLIVQCASTQSQLQLHHNLDSNQTSVTGWLIPDVYEGYYPQSNQTERDKQHTGVSSARSLDLLVCFSITKGYLIIGLI